MPNWCNTSFAIKCEDKSVLEKICNAIQDCEKQKPEQSSGSPSWIGNVFKKLGLETNECRTYWTDARIENDILHFMEESAWSRSNAIVTLQDYFLNLDEPVELNILFVSEELSEGIFETNDEVGEVFTQRYCVSDDNGTEYYDTFEQLKADMVELVGGGDFKTIQDMNLALDEADDEVTDNAHIYEISFTDL